MDFQYTGYLSSILQEPDPKASETVGCLEFTADDLANWPFKGLPSQKEWQKIPVGRKRTDEGLEFTGRFSDLMRIDNLSVDKPGFWVAMNAQPEVDERLPFDSEQFAVAEIGYRCKTENAIPSLVWVYEGGYHEVRLRHATRWTVGVHRISINRFPKRVTSLVLRLYSTMRTTETLEVAFIRFRPLTQDEQTACDNNWTQIQQEHPQRRYPQLDEFVPLGTFMSAETARRLAQMLGISTSEYWALAFEDIVRHNHNCIVLEEANRMPRDEWSEVCALAETHRVKIVAVWNLSLEDDPAELSEMADTLVRPFADNPAILAWSLSPSPSESNFQNLMRAKKIVQEADPNHPVVTVTGHPGGFGLFGPLHAAAGINLLNAHAPWNVADLVRVHAQQGGYQQFWLAAPTYVYATGTPRWHSCPEMRLMINSAFANGARGWFSYAYHNDPIWVRGSFVRTLTGPFLAFSDLWLELDQRMEIYSILAPLLLHARPARMPRHWYAWSHTSADHPEKPEHVHETSSYRLRGPDYNLYFIVSNDIRGMTSVNFDIPPEVMKGLEIYDVTDFIIKRRWEHMVFERHLEMFPGQARILLVAEKRVCDFWRDALAWRIIETDRRQLQFNYALARSYELDTREVDELIDKVGRGASLLEDMAMMDQAHDSLLNLIYDSPAICGARNKLIEASAAMCGCDGALCRLIAKGKVEKARELGLNVLPLAREIIHMRLELLQGHGERIKPHADDLAARVKKALDGIRAHV